MPGDSPADTKRFRIAFSFAGEKREFVEKVAHILAKQFTESAILYDKYHEAEFARYDLGTYLPKLYGKQSDLIVPVLCPDYDTKRWTGWEWLHIFGLLTAAEGHRVMPSRFEYANADGLSPTAGFVELDGKTPEQFATLILERLALNEDKPKEYYSLTPYEDLALLGIGALPTKGDISKRKTSVSVDEEKSRRRDFAKEMNARNSRSYSIENVFQLTSPITGAKDRLKDLQVVTQSDAGPTNLLNLPLDIESSYVAPLRLLTGMVTRLADNWPPIVNSYSKLAGNLAGTLDDFHYFVEFCWLSWGPSVDTSFMAKHPIANFVVAQVALGDEANSLPLIVETREWEMRFEPVNRVHRFGCPFKLEGLLVVNPQQDSYFDGIGNHPLFKDLFDDGVALYFCENSHATTNLGLAKPCYSTAYVWLMLEQISPPELGGPDSFPDAPPKGELKPGGTLPFFEHANLASKIGMDFLLGCLARKAIHHLLVCEKVEAYSEGGYYRYATALFDEDTVRILSAEIERLSESDQKVVAKRLVIPQKKQRRTSEDIVHFVKNLQDSVFESLKKTDATSP